VCSVGEGVELVVGLAKVQRGYSGSAQYWPTAVGAVIVAPGSVPPLEITLLAEEPGPHFTTRRLLLAQAGGAAGSSRELTHLHYDRWPNYGVPESTQDVRMLLRAVEGIASTRMARAPSSEPPLWVHCSGGVGRTGVFLSALSIFRSIFPTVPTGSPVHALPLADKEELAESLAKTVVSLRTQRHPWMVEGATQYAFAFAVIAEECEAAAELLLGGRSAPEEVSA
jgi:protein tyrosine phosphatase